ncbi:MAG TPA: hypothetical protein DD376_01260 [Sutterella sp.]|nr:hypothetical protein [Sutterella sp.]
MSPVNPSNQSPVKTHPSFVAYLALFLLILFFSGLSGRLGPTLAWFDYATLVGRFGLILDTQTFLGAGGTGARGGFFYAVSFLPSIMFAVGVIELAARYGALDAAHVLLTPILRPLLGIPGACGIAMIASLQSSDAGAAMTRELADARLITDDERTILSTFEFSSGASVIFYLTVACVLFEFLPVRFLIPLGVVLLFKVIGANLVRLYLTIRRRS